MANMLDFFDLHDFTSISKDKKTSHLQSKIM